MTNETDPGTVEDAFNAGWRANTDRRCYMKDIHDVLPFAPEQEEACKNYLAAQSQPAATVQEVPWHGERPEQVCEAIAQFWSEWEEDRAGSGVYSQEELAETAGEFATDLFDRLAALTAEPAAKAGDAEPVVLDRIMLGHFVAQYDEGAAGFFMDADDAQEVARQVNAALKLGEAIMAEVHADLSIPTDAACKVYAAIKRATPLATPPSPQPDMGSGASYERERVAKALDPALWSDDEDTAHMAASPLQVCYARERALIQADQFLVEYAALSPPASQSVEGVDLLRRWATWACGQHGASPFHDTRSFLSTLPHKEEAADDMGGHEVFGVYAAPPAQDQTKGDEA